ncbi:MAG TPA: CoA-binding protein [Nitrososphaeraceae archaeon]|jgi:succinyl-CoA synthetase alpha subunit|nr:CoA-binding protein [Nitrososphaeraceae archaeon]
MANRFDLMGLLVGTQTDEDYCKKPVIVQGMTGSFGSVHTRLMRSYGTNIIAGVTPGKGGQEFDGIPVYNNMTQAVEESGAAISAMFVPAPYFLDAAIDAIKSGIKLLVAIPEHVPVIDSLKLLEYASKRNARVIGPNTPGIIVPGVTKVGIMPAQPFTPGKVVLLSRSGTLMYELAYNLTRAKFGQKLCMGIGGDPINGTNLIECFEMIRGIDDIEGIVVVGEIGGDAEEQLAEYMISTRFPKPVIGYIAGRSAPKEKRMGHAGAIIYGDYGSAGSKMTSFFKANVPVAKIPSEVPVLLSQKLKR